MAKKNEAEMFKAVSSSKFEVWHTKDATMNINGKKELSEAAKQGFNRRLTDRKAIEKKFDITKQEDKIRHSMFPNICYFRKEG